MKELNHLSDIYKNYDTFVIDLWGVIHNGVMLNPKAIEVIKQLKNNSKKIVFLSNAPRPSSRVVEFLLKMNMDKKYLSNVMTSGEAAMCGKTTPVLTLSPFSLNSSAPRGKKKASMHRESSLNQKPMQNGTKRTSGTRTRHTALIGRTALPS